MRLWSVPIGSDYWVGNFCCVSAGTIRVHICLTAVSSKLSSLTWRTQVELHAPLVQIRASAEDLNGFSLKLEKNHRHVRPSPAEELL